MSPRDTAGYKADTNPRPPGWNKQIRETQNVSGGLLIENKAGKGWGLSVAFFFLNVHIEAIQYMLANVLRADLGLYPPPTLSSDLRHEVTCLIPVSGKLLGELAESLQGLTSCQGYYH